MIRAKKMQALACVLAVVLLAGCGPVVPTPTPAPAQPMVTPAPQTGTPSTATNSDATTSDAKPALPGRLAEQEGEPTVRVYVADKKAIEDMPIETYLQGVLAGEMKNDWPLEALKAQAILARTFALQFIADKGGSKFEGADVSTDITEAQAYDASGINDRIKAAIEETRGEVLVSDGQFIYAWFHAHSGGVTALAKEGLEYERDEPSYIKSITSTESDKAPNDVKSWTASFPQADFIAAVNKAGIGISKLNSVAIEEYGQSGRVMTLTVNGGETVSMPSLRLALGGTELKSAFLTSVALEGGNVVFKGKGYGHGVGMSQWGAYQLAEEGMKAEDIVVHYFQNVELVTMWD